MGDPEPPLATFLLHGYVGLYMYGPSHLGSHTTVSLFLARHRI